MSLISRLQKLILNEEPSEEMEVTMEEGEQDGLFMATGREPAGSPRESEQAIEGLDSDTLGLADASQGDAAKGVPEARRPRTGTGDSPEGAGEELAASAAEALEDLEATAQPQADADAGQAAASGAGGAGKAGRAQAPANTSDGSTEQESGEEQEGSAAEKDDLMSMFRATARASGATELTKEIEDVPIDRLLSELREVHGMLPSTTGADDGEAGEDVGA